MVKDYYRILQVDPCAEAEVVHAAYRSLSKRYHPDVATSPDAADRMKEINEAFEVLSNPALRARYDADRGGQGQPPGAAAASGTDQPTPHARPPTHAEVYQKMGMFLSSKGYGFIQPGVVVNNPWNQRAVDQLARLVPTFDLVAAKRLLGSIVIVSAVKADDLPPVHAMEKMRLYDEAAVAVRPYAFLMVQAVAIFVFLDSGPCDAFAPTLKKRWHYMVNVLPWMLDVERRRVVKHSGPPFTLLGTGLDRLHKILA